MKYRQIGRLIGLLLLLNMAGVNGAWANVVPPPFAPGELTAEPNGLEDVAIVRRQSA